MDLSRIKYERLIRIDKAEEDKNAEENKLNKIRIFTRCFGNFIIRFNCL